MRRSQWLPLAALPAVVALGVAAFVVMRAQHSLDRAGTVVAREGRFAFEMRSLVKMENPGFESIASAATYVSGAFYRGKLYVSGPSGLFIYGGGGGTGEALLKSYRVGIDLPAAPLGAMVVGRLRGDSEPELLIATNGQGVLIFSSNGSADGAGSFRQLLPQDADARDVTSLLPLSSGELLIGTRKRGVLVYRGVSGDNSLDTFHPQLAGLAVTAMAVDATGFWVGTRNQGVRHWHAGQIDKFEASSGLPDEQVDAIAVHGERVFIGTPLGVEEFVDGRPARLLAKNLFVNAMDANDKSLTIGSMDEGIQRVSLAVDRRPGASLAGSLASDDESAAPAQQFLRADSGGNGEVLYAVMRDGLRREASGVGWVPLSFGSPEARIKQAALTDGNISALAFGPDGRLWVGYFDRGLDILSTSGDHSEARPEHHEDDHLFCVNRIVLDPRRNTMTVATANGLVLFDSQSKPRQVMTRRDGLIADHVSDVAFSRESMVLATPAGITFVDSNGARSLYAFQGLVNNHVYALGVEPKTNEVLAGTLGGVSELVNESIQRNLTVSNSGLKHNWITAIVPVGGVESGDAWMVGTYGAGVMRLSKDGTFSAMEGGTQKMVVNPNAMLVTNNHVFAGTLGRGLWAWSRANGHWSQITAGLPSENVTALAEHGGELYVGTENGLVRIVERLLD